MKSLILIFIALGCGLVASIGISQVMDRGGAGGSLEMEQILVALSDIDISAKLDDKNVKLEDWPKNKIPEGAVRRLDDVKDKFANSRFFKGEPIHISKITDSPLSTANKIPDGYRAMPVKVDEDTVMKAIAPGDRVDVMVFLKRDLSQGIQLTGAFTILKNVRVFAVNTNTERNTESGAKGDSGMFRTVSLLLKPEHTRELVVAARVGKIVLTLRSPDEQDTDGGEEVASIDQILEGRGSLASDRVDPESVTPGPSLPSFGPNANFADVAWRMIITGPRGSEQYDWNDKRQLPTRVGGTAQYDLAPVTPEPQPESPQPGANNPDGTNNPN
ncbi:MAG: Flp pilus assembly protein CpaB [Planctomycetaceae bacterium]|nr:Flp pilus assembly protein CpaB [Planctomycetaceae bacterium]